MPTVGHFMCLGSDTDLGVDIANNFQPSFNIDPKKRDIVAKLRSEYSKCDGEIYLAADADREGSAICFHVLNILNISSAQAKRLIYTEITKPAILRAIENPVQLNISTVNSQIARQVIDKLIGYKISPLLWKEFKQWKLSAGRVQSIITKIIIEREKELIKFTSSNYFKISAGFSVDSSKINPKRPDLAMELDSRLENIDEVSNIIANTDSGLAKYIVDGVTKGKSKRTPSAPFITSSLQQEASNKLSMSPDSTMSAAQKLYEAGLITYMRTDSLVMSDEALGKIGGYITTQYGADYHKRTQYTKKAKGSQEAHECIRMTDCSKQDISSVPGLGAREHKLYNLIWKRTVASQMTPADIEIKTVKVRLDATACNPKLQPDKYNAGQPYTFVTKHEKVLFDGFLKIYSKPSDAVEGAGAEDGDEEESGGPITLKASDAKKLEALFDNLKKGQQVYCGYITAEEKQTKAPNGRYTEASLVKKLEDLGIGRPSTYATMVSKVQEKSYVEKKDIPAREKEFRYLGFTYPNELVITSKKVKVDGEKNKLIPTSLGIMVTGFLVNNFELFMDYGFTANVELLLDEIAEGKKTWTSVVKGVWDYLFPIISRFNPEGNGDSGSALSTRVQPRSLGRNPASGNEIKVIRTRTGWQLLEEDTLEKKNNRFASMGVIDPGTVTLTQALGLLVWPKLLGQHNGLPVTLNKNKNIYITHAGKHYSLDPYVKANPGTDAESITLATALTIMSPALSGGGADTPAVVQDIKFDGVTDYVIKKGPYGYYLKYLGSFNVPLPASVKKNISLANKDNCDKVIKTYLQNKGRAGSVEDVNIKPSTAPVSKQASKPAPTRGGKKATPVALAPVTPDDVTPVKKPRVYKKKEPSAVIPEPAVIPAEPVPAPARKGGRKKKTESVDS